MTQPSVEARRCAGGCETPAKLLRHDAATGLSWCWNHDPDPGIRAERDAARTKGGLAIAKRHVQRAAVLEPGAMPALDSPEACQRAINVVVQAVAEGRLSESKGRTLLAAVDKWLAIQDRVADENGRAELAELLPEFRELQAALGLRRRTA